VEGDPLCGSAATGEILQSLETVNILSGKQLRYTQDRLEGAIALSGKNLKATTPTSSTPGQLLEATAAGARGTAYDLEMLQGVGYLATGLRICRHPPGRTPSGNSAGNAEFDSSR